MHAPAPHPAPAPPPSVDTSSFLEKLGSEVGGAHKFCYLVTFSRILPDTLVAAAGGLRDAATMSRKQIGDAVRNAFNNPLAPIGGGGRPRAQGANIMKKLVVFLEQPLVRGPEGGGASGPKQNSDR